MFNKILKQCEKEWDEYINHEFATMVTEGTLDYEKFKYYMIQDFWYLRDYARCFAMLGYKGSTFEEIQFGTQTANDVINGELTLHKTLESMNIIDVNMYEISEECKKYTMYMDYIGKTGDYLELLTALMGCWVGYAKLGENIRDREIKDDKYKFWIDEYTSESMMEGAQKIIKFFNSYEDRVDENKFKRLVRIFKDTCILERDFFSQATR